MRHLSWVIGLVLGPWADALRVVATAGADLGFVVVRALVALVVRAEVVLKAVGPGVGDNDVVSVPRAGHVRALHVVARVRDPQGLGGVRARVAEQLSAGRDCAGLLVQALGLNNTLGADSVAPAHGGFESVARVSIEYTETRKVDVFNGLADRALKLGRGDVWAVGTGEGVGDNALGLLVIDFLQALPGHLQVLVGCLAGVAELNIRSHDLAVLVAEAPLCEDRG